MTTTLAAPVRRGRHRFGHPGLVPVASFVTVVYRGLFLSWRRPGNHRPYVAPQRATGVPAPRGRPSTIGKVKIRARWPGTAQVSQ